MAWESHGLDRHAQQLVLAAKQRNTESLNQAYKMRMAISYGLERFWGEQFRLEGDRDQKDVYWREVWTTLVNVLATAGITLANDPIPLVENRRNEQQVHAQVTAIEGMSHKLWNLSLEDQRISLALLAELCDDLIWWTQRYK
jgi:hypothetical protein